MKNYTIRYQTAECNSSSQEMGLGVEEIAFLNLERKGFMLMQFLEFQCVGKLKNEHSPKYSEFEIDFHKMYQNWKILLVCCVFLDARNLKNFHWILFQSSTFQIPLRSCKLKSLTSIFIVLIPVLTVELS